jgi:hypothetical protein
LQPYPGHEGSTPTGWNCRLSQADASSASTVAVVERVAGIEPA